MKNFYTAAVFFFVFSILAAFTNNCYSQACSGLSATYIITESRCAATGTIQINATGGSGNYQYKASGPITINYTTNSLLTGVPAGRYLITVKDISANCIYNHDSVTVPGNYLAPNFTMAATGVTCINGHNGIITVLGQTNGRPPFSYKIIAPSAFGVGTVSTAGVFTGLLSGNYLIQMSDSCGAIQTRSIIVDNYDWLINNYTVTKAGCDSINVTIILKDSKNNVSPNAIFNGFSYGASVIAGDTTWFSTNVFKYFNNKKHTVKLFARDACGNIKSVVWTDNAIPNVNATISVTNKVCSTFTASVSGQVNLTAPSYCIYNSSNVLVTCNTTGIFNLLPYGSYCIKITDNCYDTIITRCFTASRLVPSVDNVVAISNITCTFTATITGQTNIFNPNYCLYNSSNVLLSCNTTGIFTNLSFGTYCIKVANNPACYDTTISRCFTVSAPVPSVNVLVAITNLTCSTFTATITGQTNLNNPNYCLYNSSNVLLICNTTGIFTNLTFGSYCIKIANNPACYDTTIIRCFTVLRPVPSVNTVVSINNLSCSTFTATITDTTNLNNPKFCLYTPAHVLILCNSTGVFTNLPYGNYCIDVVNNPACYDTTITRCFSVSPPKPSISAAVTISNKTCTNFTAAITGQTNINNPKYCLYNSANVLVVCNATGIFNLLPYGSYCIETKNDAACYDTIITRCFTVTPPKPSISSAVTLSSQTCAAFSATITGQTNINNPNYCLYNSANVLVSCNTTGVFTGIPYGSYCIDTKNDPACYDTVIRRCFTAAPILLNISLSASKSCATIGTSDLKVTISSGTPGYSISLFSPAGALMQTLTTSGTSVTFLNVPNLVSPLTYKIIATDNCNRKDTGYVAPKVNTADRVVTVTSKCPSSSWPNGSSDVVVDISSNNIGGNIVPKIIKKNSTVVSINASSNAGYKYTFLDLGPATYIFDTYITDCNKHLYDTVVVNIYIFPSLLGSNAYQCDNSGFSVSVSAFGGKPPYLYEIFGSSPSLPSIITSPQSGTVFNINNGATYSLIRLRVVDGCGNASLHDASILPLANFMVSPDALECFNHTLTLRVDSILNAQYTWYKRIVPNDSVIVGTGASLYFPNLLPSDTGRYFCKIVINNGCLIKYANYVLTGFCNGVLPIDVTLTGTKEKESNKLYWNASSLNIKEYILQCSVNKNNDYKNIGVVQNNGSSIYSFLHENPSNGYNYYRLKINNLENNTDYSNTVLLKNTKFDISFYPNPVNSMLYISIANKTTKNYTIEMFNMSGQKVASKTYYDIQNAVINYPRSAAVSSGVYSITITDLQSGEMQTYKLVYK